MKRKAVFWRAVKRAASFVPTGASKGVVMGAVVVLVSGCTLSNSLNDATPSHTSSWVKPDDAQSKIGQREHPVVVAKYGGEYRDTKAEKLLAVIVGKLVKASPDKAQIFKITILNTPKVNAFALPGGYLYVTRGLLALANDSAELAAVISHEMAHVSSNHSILRNQKQADTDVGKEVVSEVLSDSVAARVALAANQLRLAEFSQDQELQADAIGIRTLGNAGFDPHAAARFLKTMEAYQALSSGRGGGLSDAAFLSSHPSTPRRVELAKQHARFFGGPDVLPAERERYLSGIDGMLFGDSADEGFVRGNSFSHLGLGVTFEALDATKVENQATAVVVSGPGDLATRFDAAVLPRGQSLEAYLKSGWVKGIDKSSIQSKTLNGLPSASARASGGNWNFVVRIIQLDRQVYRFITAGAGDLNAIESASARIASTFRRMSEAEKAALQPLRIRIVEVSAGDTLATLASRMKTGSNRLRWFQVLNGLAPGEIPAPGSKVKLVLDR